MKSLTKYGSHLPSSASVSAITYCISYAQSLAPLLSMMVAHHLDYQHITEAPFSLLAERHLSK